MVHGFIVRSAIEDVVMVVIEMEVMVVVVLMMSNCKHDVCSKVSITPEDIRNAIQR